MAAKDRSLPVLQHLNVVLHECTTVEARLAPYLAETHVRPDIYLPLLKILDSADTLLSYVNNPVAPYVGSSLHPTLKVRREGYTDWDFEPWFGQKASMLKIMAKALIKNFLTNPADAKLPPEVRATPEQYLRDELLTYVSSVGSYAQIIFDLLADEGLMIEEER